MANNLHDPSSTSTQSRQTPEPVTPRARADATAELGSEGGSYGDLTQSTRAHEQSSAATRGGAAKWKFGLALLAVLLILASVFFALTFWTGAA